MTKHKTPKKKFNGTNFYCNEFKLDLRTNFLNLKESFGTILMQLLLTKLKTHLSSVCRRQPRIYLSHEQASFYTMKAKRFNGFNGVFAAFWIKAYVPRCFHSSLKLGLPHRLRPLLAYMDESLLVASTLGAKQGDYSDCFSRKQSYSGIAVQLLDQLPPANSYLQKLFDNIILIKLIEIETTNHRKIIYSKAGQRLRSNLVIQP